MSAGKIGQAGSTSRISSQKLQGREPKTWMQKQLVRYRALRPAERACFWWLLPFEERVQLTLLLTPEERVALYRSLEEPLRRTILVERLPSEPQCQLLLSLDDAERDAQLKLLNVNTLYGLLPPSQLRETFLGAPQRCQLFCSLSGPLRRRVFFSLEISERIELARALDRERQARLLYETLEPAEIDDLWKQHNNYLDSEGIRET
jgi:hypothetical protein